MNSKRREKDIMKLMMSHYQVQMVGDGNDFVVRFHGPRDTPYEGGVWRVAVTLPEDYPFRSPSIGFNDRIFHPNVDDISGSVCLDVINQTWSPMYDLLNIFDMFLPQLLSYPNASDPLNGEAASLLLRQPERYKERVEEYVKKYAQTNSETTSASAADTTLGGHASSSTKSRHPSTDSSSSESTAFSIDSTASSSTYATLPNIRSQCAEKTSKCDTGNGANKNVSRQDIEDQDDLSSLSADDSDLELDL